MKGDEKKSTDVWKKSIATYLDDDPIVDNGEYGVSTNKEPISRSR